MIQRNIIVLILTVLTLTGAGDVWNPNAYAIVDPNGGEWKTDSVYMTIQAALQSGATTIEVRGGDYAERVTLDRPMTLLCREGAALINDGNSTSVTITAAAVTVEGCAIKGTHDGSSIGGHDSGTGFKITAPDTTLRDVSTHNLRGFSVLVLDAARLTLDGYRFVNVATDPAAALYVQYAIHLASTDDSVIRNGYIEGHSQAIGTWYNSNRNHIYNNTALHNYGYVGAGGSYTPRSAIEDYGVPDAVNRHNQFYDNTIDGTRSAGFELADVLVDTVVRDNTIRNALACFSAVGSGSNHADGLTIAGNTCYGHAASAQNLLRGENITVTDNRFVDYVNSPGTLQLSGYGGYVVRDNEFIRNSRLVWIGAQDVEFTGNTARSRAAAGTVIEVVAGSAGIAIDGNVLHGNTPAAAVVHVNDSSRIRVTGNDISGGWVQLNNTPDSVVSNNRIDSSGAYGIFIGSNSVAAHNRIRSTFRPFLLHTGTEYTLIERNYVTRQDGTAGELPGCTGTNTCAGNWTAGQVPPP